MVNRRPSSPSLAVEQLEPRVLNSAIPLVPSQVGDSRDALRSALHAPRSPEYTPLGLQEKQFLAPANNNIAEVPGALVTPLLQKGFVLSATVTPSSLRGGVIFAQYDSLRSPSDETVYVGMAEGGGISFYVYENAQVIRGGKTAAETLRAGVTQEFAVSFDPATQDMTVQVNGKRFPVALVYRGTVSRFSGGTTPLRVGGIPAEGGGYRIMFDGRIANATLRPLHVPVPAENNLQPKAEAVPKAAGVTTVLPATHSAQGLEKNLKAMITSVAKALKKTQTELPAQATLRASAMEVSTAVAYYKHGDWLVLHTHHFNGEQSFLLGNAIITPPAGSHILVIPGWIPREEMRGDLERIGTVTNLQMKRTSAPALTMDLADLFAESSIGTWTVEMNRSGAMPQTLSRENLTSGIGGFRLTGLAPDGYDGPLVAVNTGKTPVSLARDARELPARGVVLRPVKGRDVRLRFRPAVSGEMTIQGELHDLDPNDGNGITYTAWRRRLDGTLDELWTRTLGSGTTFDLGTLRGGERRFGVSVGESIELSFRSASERGESIHADLSVSVRPKSVPQLPTYAMVDIDQDMRRRLGLDIMAAIDVFDRGSGVATLSSSNDAIARFITGGRYDTMDPKSKSDYRFAIDRAKGRVWEVMIEVIEQEFERLLLKLNGVVLPPNEKPYNDGRHGIDLSQIPNLPSRAEISRTLEKNIDKVYPVYRRIIANSVALIEKKALDAARARAKDEALHNALKDAGLITPHNDIPANRTLQQQRAIDRAYESVGLPHDRSGWTVADFKNYEKLVAEEKTKLVQGGTSTDGWEWVNEPTIEKPTSKNTMIIVIYGSNQFPGDGKAGFESLTLDLRKEYDEVWTFSPGFNPLPHVYNYADGPNPFRTQPEIQKFIQARLQQNPNLKNIVFVAYSWGGGMVFDISAWLSKKMPTVKIAGAVYVDAVNDESIGAENRMPIGTHAMLNIYQSKSEPSEVFINGGPVLNSQKISDFQEIDFDKEKNSKTHNTIQRAALPHILEFIKNRVVPLKKVLLA